MDEAGILVENACCSKTIHGISGERLVITDGVSDKRKRIPFENYVQPRYAKDWSRQTENDFTTS